MTYEEGMAILKQLPEPAQYAKIIDRYYGSHSLVMEKLLREFLLSLPINLGADDGNIAYIAQGYGDWVRIADVKDKTISERNLMYETGEDCSRNNICDYYDNDTIATQLVKAFHINGWDTMTFNTNKDIELTVDDIENATDLSEDDRDRIISETTNHFLSSEDTTTVIRGTPLTTFVTEYGFDHFYKKESSPPLYMDEIQELCAVDTDDSGNSGRDIFFVKNTRLKYYLSLENASLSAELKLLYEDLHYLVELLDYGFTDASSYSYVGDNNYYWHYIFEDEEIRTYNGDVRGTAMFVIPHLFLVPYLMNLLFNKIDMEVDKNG